ncbi:P-loop containing nucleoside triphosphate hydrolase protein [Mycena sanguinolenta]|nr:P-loop containing nucleoside triphosphate hydrolase protein [Mycena sanguinolenta]
MYFARGNTIFSRFTVEKIRGLMGKPTNIRNLGIISHYGHGRSTLTDTLVSSAGITAAGDESEDASPGENLRIRSTVIPLYMKLPDEDPEVVQQTKNGSEFLINLIDIRSDTSTMLRVMDGALAVVDVTVGVSLQMETLIRKTLAERIKPVVALNKLDRALLEPNVSKEDLYQTLSRTIDSINVLIGTYDEPGLGDFQVSSEKGTVAFASALQGWGFTLHQFASRYSKRFGVDRDKMMERLWGDNFFDSKTKKWTTQSTDADGEHLERSFNMFVLDPILKIFEAVMGTAEDALDAILQKLEIELTRAERSLDGRQLLKAIMMKFLPAADALLDMVIIRLPSPVTAQRYRVSTMYEGSMEDESALGIRDCDPTAPLVLNVVKMVPTSEKGRFYAFGRVFSGTFRPGGQKKDDLFIKVVQGAFFMMGKDVQPLEECPAGNLIALAGIDQFLLKSGTLTSSETAHSMRALRFSVPQFIQVAVGVKNPKDLPALIEGLKILSKSDSLVEISTSESGDHLIAAVGQDHLAILVQDLTNDFVSVPLTISDPIIQYRESVGAESAIEARSKSPNRHNRIYVRAMPLGEELARDIESGRVRSRDDFKVAEGRKMWTFGPDTTGPNLLVDCTKGVQYPHEIKDACVAGFQWATKEGVCAEEPMRGVRFNLTDWTCNADAIHRGAGQIIPAMRRRPGTTVHTLQVYVPVQQYFGLRNALNEATSGKALLQSEFDHWAVVPGSPLEKGSEVEDIVTKIRIRKGLEPAIPILRQAVKFRHELESKFRG